MKTYSCKEQPFCVFGVPNFEKTKNFIRFPEGIFPEGSGLSEYGRRTPGARVGFKTDAERFTVRISVKELRVDKGMSMFACQSIAVMVGERERATFCGLVCPDDYSQTAYEKEFVKSGKMEEITLWLPRNEHINDVEIILPDNAKIEPPTPYKHGKALYYGSSITEGGCCCNVTNNYVALLSRWLDLDFYNFGFSGSARGELEMADIINSLDISIFIYDYDHNAPTVEHLAATHEPFFKRIREKHPTMPVLMLTRPNFRESADGAARREVVRRTYENAISSGDENVYFIDGESFFAGCDATLCTVDTTHPNDLGFYRMATKIRPTIEKMLEKVN